MLSAECGELSVATENGKTLDKFINVRYNVHIKEILL